MASSSVTFTVDMSTYPGFDPNTMTPCFAGGFTGWGPNAMNPIGNNQYTINFSLNAGSYWEFKYTVNGWSFQEDLTAAYNQNVPGIVQTFAPYINRGITIPSPAPATINYPSIPGDLLYWNAIAPSGPCFNHDTKILCLNDEQQEVYVPVQDLKKGDIVKTHLHGCRKIVHVAKANMTNVPSNWEKCMYKMAKSDNNDLTEDLVVTGWHSILVDKVSGKEASSQKLFNPNKMVDDKYTVLAAFSDKFTKMEDTNEYTYYHFAVESEDRKRVYGVWANNVLVETISINNIVNSKLL